MNVIKIIFLLIGSVIGAGFASGKEIYEFFAKYGNYSFLFIIPLFFLLYFFIKVSFKFCKKEKDNRLFENKTIKLIFSACYTILTAAMFAGLCSIFNKYFNTHLTILFYLIIFIICIFSLIKGIKVIKNISLFIVPFLIFMIIFNLIDFNILGHALKPTVSGNLIFAPFKTLIYASCNIFLSIFLISSSAKSVNKKQINYISYICSFVISIIVLVGILALRKLDGASLAEMPFLEMTSHSPVLNYFYIFCLILAISSSLITSLYSLKENLYFVNSKYKNFVCLIIPLALSFLGFGSIVKVFYPLIGIIGLIFFGYIKIKG